MSRVNWNDHRYVDSMDTAPNFTNQQMNEPVFNGPGYQFGWAPMHSSKIGGRAVGIRTIFEAAARRWADILLPSVLIISYLISSPMVTEGSQALAQLEQTDSTQLEELCRYLGIQPEKGIELDKAPRFFAATVQDPQPLFSMGLYGVKAGDRINLIHFGPGRWRIKHYATGHAIEFFSRPPPSN